MTVIPSRQVARIDFEHPIALSDDIKVVVQCTGSITDVSSFIWFNTQYSISFFYSLASLPARTRSSLMMKLTAVDREPK